jgi:hypothetical protein
MNSTVAVLLALAALLSLGFISLVLRHRALSGRQTFTIEFINRLGQFAKAEGFDAEQYTWLTQHSVQMQEELGPLGVVNYKPPGNLGFIPRYHVILNLLPELRRLRMGEYHFAAEEIFSEQANLCLDTLVRYSGVLDRSSVESLRQLRNPLAWLREGVQTILLLPISVLASLGVIGASSERRFRGSLIFRILAGFVALIGLLSAAITIALGWDQFTILVGGLFSRVLP